MNQYQILVEIIDKLRNEAPKEHKFYRPAKSEVDKLNQARSRSFIHLFLKSKFGLMNFDEREKLITDGTSDGGIDGYYIDAEKKHIYFIQSKFRRSRSNFEEKEINSAELLKMDIDNILQGETIGEDGIRYNSKILELQRKIRGIHDIGKFKYEIIILANLNSVPNSKLSKLFSDISFTIFNFKKTYSELLFPILTGTFYNYPDLYINVNLCDKSSSKISYDVKTELGTCNIKLLFIPISEIAKLMYRYKNSILKYNPRSFLTLKEGSINEEIRNTVITKDTNEFVLFNNGITILSEETSFNERTGVKDKAQLCLKNPQIINGGQTAFTLSTIYEDSQLDSSLESKLNNKEVLIKVITLNIPSSTTDKKRIEFIESISSATNKQNQVDTSDRSSNNPFLIESQKILFTDFGVLLERKRGEFHDGIKDGYIEKDYLINRNVYIKIAYACKGFPNPPDNTKSLYASVNLDLILNDKTNFRKYYFGCLCYSSLITLPDKTGLQDAIQSGIYAFISVCMQYFNNKTPDNQLINHAKETIEKVIKNWIDFQDYAINQYYNSKYFKFSFNFKTKGYQLNRNFRNYFHGRTLVVDLNDFFFPEMPYFSEDYNYRTKLITIDDFLEKHKLNISIINKIKPHVEFNKRYNNGYLTNLANDLRLEIEQVRQAIKYITSKEIGYYLWYYINN